MANPWQASGLPKPGPQTPVTAQPVKVVPMLGSPFGKTNHAGGLFSRIAAGVGAMIRR